MIENYTHWENNWRSREKKTARTQTQRQINILNGWRRRRKKNACAWRERNRDDLKKKRRKTQMKWIDTDKHSNAGILMIFYYVAFFLNGWQMAVQSNIGKSEWIWSILFDLRTSVVDTYKKLYEVWFDLIHFFDNWRLLHKFSLRFNCSRFIFSIFFHFKHETLLWIRCNCFIGSQMQLE